MERGRVKSFVGVVVSDKMDKTVTVEVSQMKKHRRYKKPIMKRSRLKAHDENNECKIGFKVLLLENRPISKTKRWRVSKILEKIEAISEVNSNNES